ASAYSLRYGTAFPADLVRRAAEHGADMLALTDRDGLYGAIKHVAACHEAGIGPIVGADLALAGGDREDRVVVLARSDGWPRLCRLVTAAHHVGERGEPRVTPELVGEHSSGLFVLLGPGSDVGRAVALRRDQEARALLDRW